MAAYCMTMCKRFDPSFPMLLVILVIALAGFVAHGYNYGEGDQSFLLPYLQSFHSHIWDADPFVQSLHAYFPSIFLWMLTFVPPAWYQMLFLFFQIFTYASVAGLLYAIARKIFADEVAAIIAAAAGVLAPNLLVINSSDVFVDINVDHSTVVIPVLLLSLLFYLKGRMLISGIVLGIAALIHPLFAGFFLVSVWVALLCERQWRLLAENCIGTAPGFAAALTYWWFHHGPSGNDLGRWDLVRTYGGGLSIWSEVHFATLLELVMFLAVIALVAIVLYQRGVVSPLEKQLALLLVGPLLFMTLAFLGGDIAHCYAIATLKLLRSSLIVSTVGLLILSGFAGSLLFHKSVFEKLLFVTLIPFLFFWKGVFLPPLCILLLVYIVFGEERGLLWAAIVLPVYAFLVWIGMVPADFSGKSEVLLILPVTFSLAAYGMRRLGRSLPVRFAQGIAVAFGVVCVALCIGYGARENLSTSGTIWQRWSEPAWWDIETHAGMLVPEGNEVLTPPYLQGFRIFSGRTPYLEVADYGAADYNPSYGLVFYNNLQRFGYSGQRDFNIEQVWNSLTPIELETFADLHGIDYIVMADKRSLLSPWHLVYHNTSYSLWKDDGN